MYSGFIQTTKTEEIMHYQSQGKDVTDKYFTIFHGCWGKWTSSKASHAQDFE